MNDKYQHFCFQPETQSQLQIYPLASYYYDLLLLMDFSCSGLNCVEGP